MSSRKEAMRPLRDKRVIQALIKETTKKTRGLLSPAKIMEVCGTHTMTVHRYGLKKMLLEAGVEMISGPGCPVCITPNDYHHAAIDLVTERENLILATFGDMTRVPTQKGSLQTVVPARRSRVKIVYSPEEALDTARKNPDKDVVFFGVGFETTVPAIALTTRTAQEEKLKNYAVLCALWLIPPPLKVLVESGDLDIQGFLYPGHVSAIIGEKPYWFIADTYGIPGVIAGFEPADILLAVASLLDQLLQGKAGVLNEYRRVVKPEGNRQALALMHEILEVKDATWRGLGLIPESGLKLKKKYAAFDAEIKYGLNIPGAASDLHGCRCGEVLRGKIQPPQCGLFARGCSPDSPQGPCMVSFEGACLAHYKYSV